MHIALFGGAFDPPHLGHQQVASSLLANQICDEVWFVPVKQHPFGKEVHTNGHREKMLSLILEPKMRVEDYELHHPGKSYSFQTLEALSKGYPQHRFSWVIGTDNLQQFHLWQNFHELLQKYRVYVYPRQHFDFHPIYKGMIKLESLPQVMVSSTMVKEKLAGHQSISGLVDERVERYIKENHLYR
jgi:nicotinate-nucleotide adenylyltransferase